MQGTGVHAACCSETDEGREERGESESELRETRWREREREANLGSPRSERVRDAKSSCVCMRSVRVYTLLTHSLNYCTKCSS